MNSNEMQVAVNADCYYQSTNAWHSIFVKLLSSRSYFIDVVAVLTLWCNTCTRSIMARAVHVGFHHHIINETSLDAPNQLNGIMSLFKERSIAHETT